MVSVIIPVYNAEKYLVQAIESVISQTYTDWEIILVDDGSTDSSGKICENYAGRTSKIKVIHKKNGGLSSARNTAITKAKGNYFLFLDADDILATTTLEILSYCVKEKECDIACGNLKNFTSSYKLYLSRLFIPAASITTNPNNFIKTLKPFEALRNILYQKKINNSVCGKLFASKLFKNIQFREGINYEDLDIISPLFVNATKIGYINIPIYFYRQHPESYVHTFSLKRADVLDVTQRLTYFIESKCPKLLPAARSRQLSANFNILGLIAANRKFIIGEDRGKADKIADSCWNKIKELRGESLRNPSVRLKNKIGIILSYIGGRPFFQTVSKHFYK